MIETKSTANGGGILGDMSGVRRMSTSPTAHNWTTCVPNITLI